MEADGWMIGRAYCTKDDPIGNKFYRPQFQIHSMVTMCFHVLFANLSLSEPMNTTTEGNMIEAGNQIFCTSTALAMDVLKSHPDDDHDRSLISSAPLLSFIGDSIVQHSVVSVNK